MCLISSGNVAPASHPDENCGNIVKNIVKGNLRLQQNIQFGTKRTSVWFQINRKMINTI